MSHYEKYDLFKKLEYDYLIADYYSGDDVDYIIEDIKKDIKLIYNAVKIVEDRKEYFENNFEDIFINTFDVDYFL